MEKSSSEKKDIEEEIAVRLSGRESFGLSDFATKHEDAYRLVEEPEENEILTLRNKFARDVDRIVFSPPYKKQARKTQVHALPSDPLVSTRLSHAQELSRIARKAGRALGLNEDLIEGIAGGHDLGHVFAGHVGEQVLSEIGKETELGNFHHSCQSLRIVDFVTHRDGFRGGTGLNLTFQTRNGILMHDGEADENNVEPNRNADEGLMQKFIEKRKWEQSREESGDYSTEEGNPFVPATLEGVLVRFFDTISYVGADIEDAIRLGLIEREWLPRECVAKLGNTNREIIDVLYKDLISHSYGRDLIGFSGEVFGLLKELKKFNREEIYRVKDEIIRGKKSKEERHTELFHLRRLNSRVKLMFEEFLYDLDNNDHESVIFDFLRDMSPRYYQHSPTSAIIVCDYLSGLTDDHFLHQLNL